MRVPERLEPLLDGGVIEEVIRPLMSGKEAEVYLVHSGGELRVAKVYKNAQHRSFQHRTDYTEGRRTRSSRGQRAMAKGSRHGRAQTEMAWRSAEVDAIGRLRSAGVRVPEPHAFVEGVLVMELVRGIAARPTARTARIMFAMGLSELALVTAQTNHGGLRTGATMANTTTIDAGLSPILHAVSTRNTEAFDLIFSHFAAPALTIAIGTTRLAVDTGLGADATTVHIGLGGVPHPIAA